jgi:hypothetical protein
MKCDPEESVDAEPFPFLKGRAPSLKEGVGASAQRHFSQKKFCGSLALAASARPPPPVQRVPLNAVNGPVLVHYLVVLTGLRTS